MDDGQEIHVLRVLFRDLPEAVSIDMVKEAASLDLEYQRLIRALQKSSGGQRKDWRATGTCGASSV